MKDTGNRAGLLRGMQSRCGGKQTGEKQREHMRETEQKTAENTENTLYVY